MTKFLLNQFQGAMVGAALASVTLSDLDAWNLKSIESQHAQSGEDTLASEAAESLDPESDRPSIPVAVDWGEIAVQLGQSLVNPAASDAIQLQSPALSISTLRQSPVSSFDVALACLPLTLCIHDTAAVADLQPSLDQASLLAPFVLNPAFLEHWNALLNQRSSTSALLSACLAATLRHPVWTPAELRKQGLNFMLSAPDEDSARVLYLVENAWRTIIDVETLVGSLIADLQQVSHRPSPSEVPRSDTAVDLVVLGLVLYCFLDTPDEYSVARLRLQQALQHLYRELHEANVRGFAEGGTALLSPSLPASALALLGALIGGFAGLDGLPLGDRVNLGRSPLSDRLQSRWKTDVKALMMLAEQLWAFWSGVDMMSDRSLSSTFVTAVPNAIRGFGQ